MNTQHSTPRKLLETNTSCSQTIQGHGSTFIFHLLFPSHPSLNSVPGVTENSNPAHPQPWEDEQEGRDRDEQPSVHPPLPSQMMTMDGDGRRD